MTTVIDESDCKVFCTRCEKTVNNVSSDLKIAVDHCYHLQGKESGMVLYTSNNHDALKQFLSERYSPSIRNNYEIVRCDGKRVA